MAYATKADIVKRHGAISSTSVFDESATNADELVQIALDDATVEIDMYLAPCYALPLVKSIPALVQICVDIAVYNLSDTKARQTETILNRYQNAIKKLTRICPKSSVEQLQAKVGNGVETVIVDSAKQEFGRTNMGAVT